MGATKPFVVVVLLLVAAFPLPRAQADDGIEDDVALELEPQAPAEDAALKLEVEQLRSKISALESSIEDRAQELKSKNDAIAHLEKIIQEKSESISSLQREIEEVQKKGAVDAAELLDKAHARAAGLEKQMEKLKNDIHTQRQKKDALDVRASGSEKKIEELKLKLEALHKTSDEQKQRIQKTTRALKVAEEALIKVQQEAASKKKELTVIYDAWLPPWLANHLDYCQEHATTNWNRHGKPAVDAFLQKASEVSVRAQKHIEPHLENVKAIWIPVLKERWTAFTIFIKPRIESASAKTVEFYENSVTTIKPHVRRAQEVADPYFQEAKKISKPYIDQVATLAQPHVEKVRVALKPYTKKLVSGYAKFLKSATAYHHQVQASVHELLKKHELTRALATKDFVWFLASACLAFPVYIVYEALTYIFCKKPKRPTRSSRTSHSHRRNKRRHAEK